MNKILKQLKLQLQAQDLLTDKERERHEHILNTFERIAENNINKSMKYIIAITADELNMAPESLAEFLDQYYQSEEENEQ